MADGNSTTTVSRQEFYSTVSLLLLCPAILFLTSGAYPDSLLGQIAAGIVSLTMLAGSVVYSSMALRERRRTANRSKQTPEN